MVLTEAEKLEVKCMEDLFQAELEQWKTGRFKVKLLILGEAPRSCAKYFYGKNRGGWLSGIKAYLGVHQNQLLNSLREKGILAIDLYKYPIDTDRYDKDKSNVLFDETYLNNRIDELERHGLINKSTKAVFRYKKLIIRGLPLGFSLTEMLIRDAAKNPISLFIQERPNQLLSEDMQNSINTF